MIMKLLFAFDSRYYATKDYNCNIDERASLFFNHHHHRLAGRTVIYGATRQLFRRPPSDSNLASTMHEYGMVESINF